MVKDGCAGQIRIEYAGALYHLLNRGDRREVIFRDDVDRQSFLEILGNSEHGIVLFGAMAVQLPAFEFCSPRSGMTALISKI